jgi:hypothetical protein
MNALTRCLLVVALLTLCAAGAAPAGAQAPDPTVGASATASTGAPEPGSSAGGIDVRALLQPVIDDLAQHVALRFLIALAQEIVAGLRSLVDGAVGGSFNILTQTPPALSYANPAVEGLAGTMRGAANAGLALVVMWGGVNVILRQHLGSPYHAAMQLMPRAALGALLVNTSGWWTRLAIDANNALCGAAGGTGLPGFERADPAKQVFLELVVAAVYLVTCLLLFLQQLMRLALVDVCLVAAPLGLLCWVLPQTQAWARLWSSTFLGCVFAQFAQALALHLGASVMAGAAPMGVDAAVMSLLLGTAAVVLTLKIPGLILFGLRSGLGDTRVTGAGGHAAGAAAASFHAQPAAAGRQLRLPGRWR